MTRRCAVCDMPLTAKQHWFCSVDCRYASQRVNRTCERCGEPRAAYSIRYCSRICARTAPKTVACPTCGRGFPFNRLTHGRYCSEVCRERSYVWRQTLDVMAAEPDRWWTYPVLAKAVYGFADWEERKAIRQVVCRLRARGVAFERPPTRGWRPARFRLAAVAEVAS